MNDRLKAVQENAELLIVTALDMAAKEKGWLGRMDKGLDVRALGDGLVDAGLTRVEAANALRRLVETGRIRVKRRRSAYRARLVE